MFNDAECQTPQPLAKLVEVDWKDRVTRGSVQLLDDTMSINEFMDHYLNTPSFDQDLVTLTIEYGNVDGTLVKTTQVSPEKKWNLTMTDSEFQLLKDPNGYEYKLKLSVYMPQDSAHRINSTLDIMSCSYPTTYTVEERGLRA